jgi:catechol 2,3-dioxygenase-like lactoylglutathione lyase family enzyme
MTVRRRCLTVVVLLFAPMLLSGLAFSQSAGSDLGIVRLRYATIVVRDYDEALHWYTDVLGLEKVEEGSFGEDKRWLVIAPRGHKDVGIILEIAKPISSTDPIHDYESRVGKETRWVFEVEDCRKFYDLASKRGVKFVENPVDEVWGSTEAMFEDLYGNIFVVESSRPKRSGSKP